MSSRAANAVPANVAAAVAAPDRNADMRSLDESRKPVQILQFFGLRQGDNALELFGSNGYWGVIMARAVGPQGSVDSWEAKNFVNPKVISVWGQIHRAVPNLSMISSPANRISLPAAKYDFVMFNLNYHDLYWEDEAKYHFPRMDPKPFVRQLYASIKPGGTLGVIDHVANPGGDTRDVAQTLHRIDPATVRRDFEAAGFKLEAESSILRNPADKHKVPVFDASIRGHTDRIVYKFRKPG